MAVRTQASTSSLSKYASAKSPGVDLYNGSTSRDFCNSFWGVGDAGPNILFARMRGAARTTDNLRNFWKERSAIEEDYARKLHALSRMTLGKDEIGELRNALDTLSLETEKQANTHLQLASQIRSEMEVPTAALLNKQIEYRRTVQGPVEKKFKNKLSQESYVVKAREKYMGDCVRIGLYTQQIEHPTAGTDVDKIRPKLRRAEQTVAANEKDYANFCKTLADMLPSWEEDWKNYCDSCQDLEEERLDFMKDNVWAYANAVSTVCVVDDESCETVRTVLDQLETDRDMVNFVQEYGTGNSIPKAPEFTPYSSGQDASASSTSLPGSIPPMTTSTHSARFTRTSRRPAAAPPYQPPPPATITPATPEQTPVKQPLVSNTKRGPDPPSPTVNGVGSSAPAPAPIPPPVVQAPPPSSYQPRNPPPPENIPPTGTSNGRRNRESLPPQPVSQQVPSATPPTTNGNHGGGTGDKRILFYVEAMYDYVATIDEEFSFQAGDIIAVTEIPDDGWWSGELLDEARREEGRHVFPSNFVRLF